MYLIRAFLLFIFDAVGCCTTLDPDSVVIDGFAQCPFGSVFDGVWSEGCDQVNDWKVR